MKKICGVVMHRPVTICTLLFLCLISDITGAAQGGSGSLHYVFIGTASGTSHVYQLYLSSPMSNSSSTNVQDVTAAAGAPVPASASASLTSFADKDGEHVLYLGTNNHVYQLYYGSQSIWAAQDLTAQTGGALAVSGSALTSFSDTPGEHVIYLGSNQHVYQLFFNWTSWYAQDLTAETGGALAVGGSALTSFSDKDGEHVLYLGSNQHVYQLFFSATDTWEAQDLTAAAGAALAAGGSALSSLSDQFGEHVFYLGTNQNVYHLFFNWTSWSAQNLTTYATYNNYNEQITVLASSGSTLSSFADANGEHVYFLSGVAAPDEACSPSVVPAGSLSEFDYTQFLNNPWSWYFGNSSVATSAPGSALAGAGSACSTYGTCETYATVEPPSGAHSADWLAVFGSTGPPFVQSGCYRPEQYVPYSFSTPTGAQYTVSPSSLASFVNP